MFANLLAGNAIEVLRTIEAGSVQTVVTSPPYWGMRDYGTEPQIWPPGVPLANGRELCPAGGHSWIAAGGGLVHENRNGYRGPSSGAVGSSPTAHIYKVNGRGSSTCSACGAWLGELGLEPSPLDYVDHLVAIFREVRRVLKPDGTVWLNLGDSYNSGSQFNNHTGLEDARRYNELGKAKWAGHRALTTGLKPKDLVGIPWRVALALQADGWFLRSDIIWNKPSCMPESVKDRPTRNHEYIFLLSKSSRYYYDAEAIKEPMAGYERKRRLREIRQGLTRPLSKLKRDGKTGLADPSATGAVRNLAAVHKLAEKGTRNKRTVWTIAPRKYKGAHFATFPPELAEPCVLAGSRPGDTVGDPFCGSGTTGLVALRNNRNFVGIDIKPEYLELTRERLAIVQPLILAERGRAGFDRP